MNRVVLVTGPARSGKSEWAEWLAHQSERAVSYIATAQLDPDDAEWQARITQHQQRRPAHWRTIAAPIDLGTVLQAAQPTDCLLIDSLGTWLTNLLEQDDRTWQATLEQLADQVIQATCQIILVAEETGWGVVPSYATGRRFRDRLGQATRRLAAVSDVVYLVTGGYALNLTQLGHPLAGLAPIHD